MSNPQQPELHRSGRGESTQDAQKLRAETRDKPGTGGRTGPVPPANKTEDERKAGG
jgi:hypothetical protein